MSKLLEAQLDFCSDVARLILRAESLGLRCKFGEALRFKETQELWVRLGKSQTMSSRHLDGLAVDLLLFKDGRYLTASEEYEALGVFWEMIRPGLNVWGGRWKMRDGNHFERKRP